MSQMLWQREKLITFHCIGLTPYGKSVMHEIVIEYLCSASSEKLNGREVIHIWW